MVKRRPASRTSRNPTNLVGALRSAAATGTFVKMLEGYGGLYGLFKFAKPLSTEYDGNGAHRTVFSGIQYFVRRKLQTSAGRNRSSRPSWGVAKCWQPYECSQSSRVELGMTLCHNYLEFHTTYHRLVGQALLGSVTHWNDTGKLLAKPKKIVDWAAFHVHHKNHKHYDQRLRNLCIVSKKLHHKLTHEHNFQLPEPSCGWGGGT